jgi:hypothetical protein
MIKKKIFILLLFLFIILSYYKTQNKSNKICNINSFIEKSNKTKNFFFLEKKEKLNYCKNYAIFIYNYPFDNPTPKYGNIGDYIQSLAALQFLPKNCLPIFIDRDMVEFYNGENANLIMNGWYRISKGNKEISKNLSPIFVSIHISNINTINPIFINYLKKYEPIGCRDIYTLEGLKRNGINAYFSSCLTTTLDIDYFTNESDRTDDIIFIDYNFGYNSKIDAYIKSLKSYNFSNRIHTNHYFNMNLSQFERFKLAKDLIDKYARAKLVITTRIHGALPCLALNTPFIFVNKYFDRRYYGLYELFNRVGINSSGQFDIKVNLNKNNYVINPKEYLKYSNKLKKLLTSI